MVKKSDESNKNGDILTFSLFLSTFNEIWFYLTNAFDCNLTKQDSRMDQVLQSGPQMICPPIMDRPYRREWRFNLVENKIPWKHFHDMGDFPWM